MTFETDPAMTAATPHAIVIGGGPAGLMAADAISAAGMAVTIYDRMPTLGRKFLLAGRGGLNLTHSEDVSAFMARYDRPEWLQPFVQAFPPQALQELSAALGEPVFTGTSGRVFPKSFKSSPFLRAWLRRLDARGVVFKPRHHFKGFDAAGAALFDAGGASVAVQADATVLALGGASWPKLGANGDWVAPLAAAGVPVAPLLAANCGFTVAWTETFAQRFAGVPLKTVRISHAGKSLRGDVMVTRRGIEGGAVYALSRLLRQTLMRDGTATLEIDLRPDIDVQDLAHRLEKPRAGQSASTFLRKAAGLPPVAIALLRETRGGVLTERAFPLAERIKHWRLVLTGLSDIDRAISSAGGVEAAGCDGALMLKALPGVFVAGEMLDWEAPTGGYLLQACFSTGAAAGRGAVEWARGARAIPT